MPVAAILLYGLLVLAPDWLQDPSSHNLLPFEIGIWFWPSLPYIAFLTAVRAAAVRDEGRGKHGDPDSDET